MGSITKAIHNIGTAVWWGGTLMGTLAMNPSVEVLDDPEERGKMVDEGWARFQPYAAAGLTAAIITHIAQRRNPPRNASGIYKNTARLKDLLLGAALVSSVASLALGEYAVYQDADACTDEDHDHDHDELSSCGLSPASIVQLASGLGLFITSAIMSCEREN